MGGRDSAVGTGDPHDAGPVVPNATGAVYWARATLGKGPGAPTRHVGIEGESPWRALPSFRELVGSEAVLCPGVPLLGNRQKVVPAKGATRPSHETVQGHEGKLEGMARNLRGHQHRRRESWLLEPVV